VNAKNFSGNPQVKFSSVGYVRALWRLLPIKQLTGKIVNCFVSTMPNYTVCGRIYSHRVNNNTGRWNHGSS